MKMQIPSQWNKKVMIPVRTKAFQAAAKLMNQKEINIAELTAPKKSSTKVA